jgi:hypothetical protein
MDDPPVPAVAPEREACACVQHRAVAKHERDASREEQAVPAQRLGAQVPVRPSVADLGPKRRRDRGRLLVPAVVGTAGGTPWHTPDFWD